MCFLDRCKRAAPNSNSFEKDIPILQGVSQGASVLFYIDVEDIDELYNSLKEQVEIAKELETTWVRLFCDDHF